MGMCASLFSAVAFAGPVGSPFFTHYKEARSLTLNTSVVAIYHNPELGRPMVADSVIEGTNFRQGPIAGWYFLDVPGGGTPETVARLSKLTNGLVTPVYYDKFGGPLVFSSTINVRFNANVSVDEAESILSTLHPTSVKSDPNMSNLYEITTTAADGYGVLNIANQLAKRSEVRYAVPESTFTGRKQFNPNDPYFHRQWALGAIDPYPAGWPVKKSIDAVTAWDVTTGNPAIKVGVIDDGIQLDHPDLAIADAKDFVPQQLPDGTIVYGDGGPLKKFDVHGTAVAGVIGASINNAKGPAGVAPNCGLVSARAHVSFSLDGFSTSPAIVANALFWMRTIGVRISNNSNVYGFEDPGIEDAYNVTRATNMTHFAAAGNDGSTTLGYPAKLSPVVLAVTGVYPDGNLAAGATTGTGISFSAPGAFVMTTDRTGNTDGYVGLFGADLILSADGNYLLVDSSRTSTSYACAYAAGVGALALSVRPDLSPDQLSDLLEQTCEDLFIPATDTTPPDRVGYDDRWGWGLINAARVVGASLIQSVDITPTTLNGGEDVTVTLHTSYPLAVDHAFPVTSSNTDVVANGEIDMAAGDTVGTVKLKSTGVDTTTTVNITVDSDSYRTTTVLTVLPAALLKFTLSSGNIYGGETTAGIITLKGKAGPNGAVVTFSDNSAIVTAPAPLVIGSGRSAGSVSIATSRVTSTQNTTVTASRLGVNKTASLKLKPVLTDILSLTLGAPSINGGSSVLLSATMTNPAPPAAASISLNDNNTATTMPAALIVQAGQTKGSVTITTAPVAVTTSALIVGTYLGVYKTVTLTIKPTLWVTAVTVTPSTIRGGFTAVGRVNIYSPAPAGGVGVSVSTTNSKVQVPSFVLVPAGRTWVEFTVTTSLTNVTVDGLVKATGGGKTQTAPVTVYK